MSQVIELCNFSKLVIRIVCRYGEAVRDIIRVRKDYKKGCTAAIALQLFDHFPISDFCLPLLLCNNTSDMEAYLARSVH